MTDATKMERKPYTGVRKSAAGCSGMHSAEPWRTTDGVSVSSGRCLEGIIWIRRNDLKLVKLQTKTDSKNTIICETSVDIAKYETVLVRDCFNERFKVMIAAEDSVEIADSILEYLGKGDYEKSDR
jgi:hypothetical protein